MSAAGPLAAPPVATQAGADLRAARERLGWSLPEIADNLRIRLCHLEALEQGRISLLPANAYAVGYARAYARALGLDPEEMVRRIKTEAAEISGRTELAFPVPVADRGLPAGAVIMIGLVLSVGAYVGWYRLSGDGHLPAETVIAIPERLAPLAEQALPAPAGLPAPIGSLAANAPAVPPDPLAASTVKADAAPRVAQISPTSAAAALVHEPNEAPPPAVAMPDDTRIVVHAVAEAWVQVKDRGGAVLLSRIMKAGETWPVPRQDNLILTTGNAGGTELLVDGTPAPSLGGSGAVRRDVPLDPELLKNGRLSAPPVLAVTHPR